MHTHTCTHAHTHTRTRTHTQFARFPDFFSFSASLFGCLTGLALVGGWVGGWVGGRLCLDKGICDGEGGCQQHKASAHRQIDRQTDRQTQARQAGRHAGSRMGMSIIGCHPGQERCMQAKYAPSSSGIPPTAMAD